MPFRRTPGSGSADASPVLAMTVDIEPWWASDLLQGYPGKTDEDLPRQVGAILDLLEECGGRATFFVLGEVAEKLPGMVEEIHRRGHEVASHGYDHTSLHRLKPHEFREREERTAAVLRSITGERPLGFRAPNYSLRPKTSWLYPILEEMGYLYSSSLFPMRTPLYGWPGAPLRPFLPAGKEPETAVRDGGGLVEFPVAVYSRLGMRIPVCGGGYLRYQPASLVGAMLRRVARERPAVFSIHPRDLFAPPAPRDIGLLPRLVLFGSIGDTEKKVRKLTRSFRLRALQDFLP